MKNILILLLLVSCKTQSTTETTQHNKILFIEEYGSVCCPKDPKHKDNILTFITKFENNNNVKITNTYQINFGKEGESKYFLTLNGLTKKQQKNFIKLRKLKYPNNNNTPILVSEVYKIYNRNSVKKLN